MAGRVLQLLRRSYFDMSSLGATAQVTILPLTRINVAEYTEGTLLMRLHPGSAIPTGATITAGFVADGFDPDDPAPAVSAAAKQAPFFAGSYGVAIISFDSTSHVPALGMAALVDAFNNPGHFGGLLQFEIIFQQGSSSTTFTAVLSAELSLKCGPRRGAAWPRAARSEMLSNAERSRFIRDSRTR